MAALARRIGVAAPLCFVAIGIGLSFVPDLGTIEPDPEWILAGVLPPLLYASAVRMPAVDFRRDLKAINGLAVVLVALTTLVSGLVFNALIPGIGLAAAFALGAIISPTDAVAATSVGQRLGLPARLVTILEGEGLVNDASALVLLSSAVAATTSSPALAAIGLKFLYSVAIAIVVGWIVGEVNVRVRPLLDDPILNTAVSFVIPFLAYLPAEALHASGILAVVVTGLVTGHESPRRLSAQDRLAESINWATIAFLLENGIFLLFGLQLKTLVDQASAAALSVGSALWIGLAASVLVVLLRVLYVGPLVSSMRRDADRAASMAPLLDSMLQRVGDLDLAGRLTGRRRAQMERRVTRKQSDVAFLVSHRFGWRGGVVLTWAGMRGAVTVAAAQSLPDHIRERPQLLLIAFVVAATTLLVQGVTLPKVIRAVRLPADDPAADSAEYRELLGDLAGRAESLLDDPELIQPDGSRYGDGVIDRVRDDLRIRVTPPEGTEDWAVDPRRQYRELMLRVLAAERDQLLSDRSSGRFSSRAIGRAQRSLDIDEARLQRIAGFTDDAEPAADEVREIG